MDLKYCRRCKKLFQVRINPMFCNDCMEYFDKCFETVKQYISDNPSANFAQVVEGTRIEEAILFDFIRSGRIEFTNPDQGLPCEICGKSIGSGKYCKTCADSVKTKLEESKKILQSKIAPTETAKKQSAREQAFHIRQNEPKK